MDEEPFLQLLIQFNSGLDKLQIKYSKELGEYKLRENFKIKNEGQIILDKGKPHPSLVGVEPKIEKMLDDLIMDILKSYDHK